MLDIAKNYDRFDLIICSDDVEISKPNPEIHLKICKQLNVNHEEVIIVEDSNIGVIAAHNAGIKCFMIPDLMTPNNESVDKSYAILSSLKDLIAILDLPKYY